jgi:hypothetical protein
MCFISSGWLRKGEWGWAGLGVGVMLLLFSLLQTIGVEEMHSAIETVLCALTAVTGSARGWFNR